MLFGDAVSLCTEKAGLLGRACKYVSERSCIWMWPDDSFVFAEVEVTVGFTTF